CAAGRNQLVVNEVGRHSRKGQITPALADDLVAGRKADEVGKALNGYCVTVAHELGDRVAHRRDLESAAPAGSISDQPSTTSPMSPHLRASCSAVAGLAATASTDSPKSRTAVSTWSADTTNGGDKRTTASPASSTSKPRWNAAH